MKKFVLAMVFITMIVTLPISASALKFVGETYECRNLSDTSAYLEGYVGWSYTEDEPIPDCLAFIEWFEYWEEGSDEIIETEHNEYWWGSSAHISCHLTDLKPSTTYYYKTCGTSNVMSFTTLAEPQPKITPVIEKTRFFTEINIKHQSINYSTDKFFVAFYKDDEFVGVKSGEYEIATSLDFDYAKVMVWNKDTMAPVTTPEIVYNTTE